MKTTIIIKTFERPDCLYRLLDSIRKYYPVVPIIVLNDGKKSVDVSHFNNVELITTEFDIGLSEGRNRMVERVETEYTLLLDDDFIFTEKTKIGDFEKVLDATDCDIIGGALEDVNGEISHYEGCFYRDGNTLSYVKKMKEHRQGIERYDFVFNFFLARTDTLKKHKWDSELKLAEHTDFFLTHKGQINVGYLPSVVVMHDHVPDPNYSKYRARAKKYVEVFAKKHGIDVINNYTGSQYVFEKQRTKRKTPTDSFPGNTTAIIKTFERPTITKRLVKSIRKYYPEMKIIILNDGTEDIKIDDPKTKCIKTEFDIGLSEGRNRLVQKVKTPYTLLLDDDFVFFDDTKIEMLEDILETTDCDIVAGAVTKDGKNIGHFEGCFEHSGDTLICNKNIKEIRQGVPRYDFVFNFFLARTETLKEHKWDKRLKLTEHTDFFLTHKDKINVGYCEDVVVLHSPYRPADYMYYRNRDKDFLKLFMDKWRLKIVETFQGLRIERIGEGTKTTNSNVGNIYVTGSHGYIGSRLVNRLENVIECDLKIGKDAVYFEPQEDLEYIFHLAAQVSVPQSFDDMMNDARNNILTTIKQIDIANKKNAKLIYVTSAASIDPESPYGLSKKVGEDYIKLFCRKYVIIRLPNIFGDSDKGVVSIFENSDMIKVTRGCTRTFVHVDDVVDALVMAKEWEKGEYHLGDGKDVSIEDIAKAFKKKYILMDPSPGEILISKMKNTTPNWQPKTNIFDYIKQRI